MTETIIPEPEKTEDQEDNDQAQQDTPVQNDESAGNGAADSKGESEAKISWT